MKNTFNLLLLTLLTFFTSTVNATTYYVSPTGSDSNPGTIGSPYLTVGKLNSVLVAGDVAYFRGGTYRSTDNAATIFFWFHNLNGTASNPINIFAYPNEKPIFNMDNITPTASRPYGMALSSCSYLHLKGFTIKNLKQKAGDGFSRGFYLYQSPNCEIEQFEIFNIGGGGFGIEQSSGTYVLNCDVHHCGDGLPTASSAWNGGDCYNCTGGDQSTNLVFEGCRGWMTGDDIWDFFAWNGNKITMKNCWAFWASVKPWGINGQEPTEAPYNPATGMGMTPNDASTWINPSTHTWNSAWCTASNSGEGFKLGGGTIAYGNIPAPTVTKKFIYNCLGFENRGNGFSANMQADASHNMLMENCAAFGNFDGGWSWGTGRATGIAFTMKNNWAYHNGASYGGWTGNGDWVYDGLADNVSNDYWDTHYYSTVNYGNLKPSPVAQITDGDFLSVSSSGVTGPRQADGSLPNLPFLKLAASSKLTDKGVNVGLPFLGTAPDLGPFESTGISSNIQPTANAGTDKIISLPINTVSLTGTGTDPDGTITAYQWSQISGPALGTLTGATLASVTVSGLVQGVYQFQLKVTDNNAAIGTDLVQVTVNAAANQPPVANAGGDQTIQLPVSTATLTGTGTDADGTISSYLWTKVSGPASGTITSSTLATTTLTALVQGVYKFELKVTDNSGAATKDTMQVTVNAAANQPPVANAGADQTIQLPVSTATLTGTGTDADGTISSYLWTKVSGPASGTITSSTLATTTLTALVQGVYKFELKVTDNSGAAAKDTIQVTVNAAIVQKIIHVNICGLNNPYNGTGWNNWKPNSNTASPNFKYADGAISLVNTLLSKQGQLFDNGPSYLITTTNCPSQVLRFSSATRRARILSINGLDTSKNYSFEFFGSSTVAGNQTEFKINGLSKVINTYYSSSSAKFYNVRPNAAGVVEVQIISMVTFNYLSAFNIIEQTGTINVSGLRTEVSNPAVVEGTTIVTTWPLPLTNSFTVNLNGNSVGSYQLSLVDVSGKLMWSKQINKSATSVNETIYMGNIPDGEYFLQVIDPKQEKSSYSLIKN